ncbi:MAG: accessory factor UbiK family protein [Gammaproteobacteria bacterium]
MKQDDVDKFFQAFSSLLPDDLWQARADMEKNMKAALHATFSRMDLVTREELEVQKELLSRTRALLEELQARVNELEQQRQESPDRDQ